MTVRELIELLSKLPPESKVKIPGGSDFESYMVSKFPGEWIGEQEGGAMIDTEGPYSDEEIAGTFIPSGSPMTCPKCGEVVGQLGAGYMSMDAPHRCKAGLDEAGR